MFKDISLKSKIFHLNNASVMQCWQMHNYSTYQSEHSILPSRYLHLVYPLNGQIEISGIRKTVSDPFIAPILDSQKSIKIDPNTSIFGLHIQPFYAADIFGSFPTNLSRNANMISDLLSPFFMSKLKDAIFNSANFESRSRKVIMLFDPFFNRIASKKKVLLSKCLEKIDNQEINQKYFSEKIGVSERWIQQVYKELMGVTPTEMKRIARFNKLIQSILTKETTITSLAHDCGYYDQSHAIREFKKYSGITPRQFAKNKPAITRILNY